MSHKIYTTEAIILSGRSLGEANRLFYLLTPDFGLITALAQGVRYLKSKLRYNLQNLSVLKISLVKGREFWRIVNAESRLDLEILRHELDKHYLTTRVKSLLLRLVPEAEENQTLFFQTRDDLLFLNRADLNHIELQSFELIMVLRLLDRLGYIKSQALIQPFLDGWNWPESSLVLDTKTRQIMVQVINQAIKHSHL